LSLNRPLHHKAAPKEQLDPLSDALVNSSLAFFRSGNKPISPW
jgi:hypothetical protein